MSGKSAFVLGAAVGYVFGTRAGRERYEAMKARAARAWQHPSVQSRVARVEESIGGSVRSQGAQMTDRVADLVKERLGFIPPQPSRPRPGQPGEPGAAA